MGRGRRVGRWEGDTRDMFLLGNYFSKWGIWGALGGDEGDGLIGFIVVDGMCDFSCEITHVRGADVRILFLPRY